MKKTETGLNFSSDVFPAKSPELEGLRKRRARLEKALWAHREKMARSYSKIPPDNRAEFMRHHEEVFSHFFVKYIIQGYRGETSAELKRTEFFMQYMKRFCQWFVFYQKDAERIFKKKFSISIDEAEKKAKKGDVCALGKLIAFEKRYLFKDWVKAIIIEAQYDGNRKDLSLIGDALKSNFSYQDQSRKNVRLERDLRTYKLMGNDFTKWNKAKWFSTFLTNEYSRAKIDHGDLENVQEFWKYLKRIGLR